MKKIVYRVRNWEEYNEALVKRGSLRVWLNKEVIKQWQGQRVKGKRGRPTKCSDAAQQVLKQGVGIHVVS